MTDLQKKCEELEQEVHELMAENYKLAYELQALRAEYYEVPQARRARDPYYTR